ncbi:glycosyltransferase [Roseivirga ehrenbergii]|uniref:glycosyltransferase n=1 Tax=Roseivirga ehrenbergii (strain DSM 102268 / JCM 13514 / KCTC 12282 / NCIMB 14502 / KMM 6017) TaxID=279360 RepID=UPI0012FD9B8A|nr:glycosyltransferase [Roseivirga ehrenbergii]
MNNSNPKTLIPKHHTHDTRSVISSKTVDVIIPFYNESGNIINAHENVVRLENIFNIKNYIYINNGSKDRTFEELKWLEQKYVKIKIINIKENIGYGNGFKKGFELSKSDLIITNHADQQFDAFQFFSAISDDSFKLSEGCSIFPLRKGRPLIAALFTAILRCTLSVKLGTKLNDFNGQPKLIDAASLTLPINDFPNNFSFDLMLYIASGKKQFFPIFEQPRKLGESSWNHGIVSKFYLFKSYLKSTKRIKTIIKQSQT